MVDKDPLGGACLNRGCIPSKTMIYPANVIKEARGAEELGVKFSSLEIDFQKIMNRTRKVYLEDRERMRKGLEKTQNLDFFNEVGRFVSDYTMEVGDRKIKADKIFLFSGARPLVTPIDGIEKVDYLTKRDIFEIKDQPKSLVILGGGFIAAESAHFFSTIETKVTIMAKSRLLSDHDPDISGLLEEKLSSSVDLKTYCKALEVGEEENEKYVVVQDTKTGKKTRAYGGSILMAIGRRSNADLLEVDNTGVETDEEGWIVTDEFLETSKENIWAGGGCKW